MIWLPSRLACASASLPLASLISSSEALVVSSGITSLVSAA